MLRTLETVAANVGLWLLMCLVMTIPVGLLALVFPMDMSTFVVLSGICAATWMIVCEVLDSH